MDTNNKAFIIKIKEANGNRSMTITETKDVRSIICMASDNLEFQEYEEDNTPHYVVATVFYDKIDALVTP